MLRTLITTVFMLTLGSMVFAQSNEEFIKAFNKAGETADLVAMRKVAIRFAKQGNANAQNLVGTLYHSGEWGVQKDISKAMKWYHLSAKQNFAMAHNNLANLYISGEFVSKNLVTAHMWFQIAEASGDRNSRWARRNLQRKMTRKEIAEAKQRAKTCLATHYQDCG